MTENQAWICGTNSVDFVMFKTIILKYLKNYAKLVLFQVNGNSRLECKGVL